MLFGNMRISFKTIEISWPLRSLLASHDTTRRATQADEATQGEPATCESRAELVRRGSQVGTHGTWQENRDEPRLLPLRIG